MTGLTELEIAGRLFLGALTVASEHRISEREIVDALSQFPAMRQIRVQA